MNTPQLEATQALAKVFDSYIQNLTNLKAEFEQAASGDKEAEGALYLHFTEAQKQYEILRTLVVRYFATVELGRK